MIVFFLAGWIWTSSWKASLSLLLTRLRICGLGIQIKPAQLRARYCTSQSWNLFPRTWSTTPAPASASWILARNPVRANKRAKPGGVCCIWGPPPKIILSTRCKRFNNTASSTRPCYECWKPHKIRLCDMWKEILPPPHPFQPILLSSWMVLHHEALSKLRLEHAEPRDIRTRCYWRSP